MPILCPVEVGFHRCYDRDLATHIPYFSFVLAPQSRQIRWHYLLSGGRRLDAFHISISYFANNQHNVISPSPRPSTTLIIRYIWLAWSSHLSTHLTVGVAPNIQFVGCSSHSIYHSCSVYWTVPSLPVLPDDCPLASWHQLAVRYCYRIFPQL